MTTPGGGTPRDPWEADDAVETPPEQPAPLDPVRALGRAAVRQASLSASGARVSSSPPAAGSLDTIPDFGEGGASHTYRPSVVPAKPPGHAPAYEPPEIRTDLTFDDFSPYQPVAGPPLSGSIPLVGHSAPDALAAQAEATPQEAPVMTEPTRDPFDDVIGLTSADNDGPMVRDHNGLPLGQAQSDEAAALAGGASDVPPPPIDDEPVEGRPWWKNPWIWGAAGVALLAIVLVPLLTSKQPPEPAPTVTVTAGAIVPSTEPVPLTEPTAFLAAVPASAGKYARSSAVPGTAAELATLPVEPVEYWNVIYTDGASSLITVTAIQHYTPEEATANYEALKAERAATDPTPVLVAGSQVGESVRQMEGDFPRVVWQNGTGVFVLTGPAAELEQLFAKYGL